MCRDYICNKVGPFDLKNYFDLDDNISSTIFNESWFNWIGFPKKKAKNLYHKTQSSEEHIKKQLSTLDDGTPRWKNSKYLIIQALLKSITSKEVIGEFSNKNMSYKYEGFKEQGYSLKGMSGGALFYSPKKTNKKAKKLSDIYSFLGIGLEYRKNKIIKGVPRVLVEELIVNYLNR